MTNEERFIASCQAVGEADVRQKLNAERYSGQKTIWASEWLDQVEGAKSDATKAEERSSRVGATAQPNRHFAGVATVLLVLLVASVALFLQLR